MTTWSWPCRCGQPDCKTCWLPWAEAMHFSRRSTGDLVRFIEGGFENGIADNSTHMLHRVNAYMFLIYRDGIFDARVPYIAWHLVFGDARPPWTPNVGAFKDSPPLPMLHAVNLGKH